MLSTPTNSITAYRSRFGTNKAIEQSSEYAKHLTDPIHNGVNGFVKGVADTAKYLPIIPGVSQVRQLAGATSIVEQKIRDASASDSKDLAGGMIKHMPDSIRNWIDRPIEAAVIEGKLGSLGKGLVKEQDLGKKKGLVAAHLKEMKNGNLTSEEAGKTQLPPQFKESLKGILAKGKDKAFGDAKNYSDVLAVLANQANTGDQSIANEAANVIAEMKKRDGEVAKAPVEGEKETNKNFGAKPAEAKVASGYTDKDGKQLYEVKEKSGDTIVHLAVQNEKKEYVSVGTTKKDADDAKKLLTTATTTEEANKSLGVLLKVMTEAEVKKLGKKDKFEYNDTQKVFVDVIPPPTASSKP